MHAYTHTRTDACTHTQTYTCTQIGPDHIICLSVHTYTQALRDRVPLGLQEENPLGKHNPQSTSFFHSQKKRGKVGFPPPTKSSSLRKIKSPPKLPVKLPPTPKPQGADSMGTHSDKQQQPAPRLSPAQSHTQGGLCYGALGLRLLLAELEERGRGQFGGWPSWIRPDPGIDCSRFGRKVCVERQYNLGRKWGRDGSHTSKGQAGAGAAPFLVPPQAKSGLREGRNPAASPVVFS